MWNPFISQQTWDEMPEEEKDKIRSEYRIYSELSKVSRLDTEIYRYSEYVELMEAIFGKNNLK